MENQKTIQQTDEMEIDLLELLAALRRKLWLILLAAVIGGGIAGAFSKFVLTPQYTSTAMMYILSQETTLTSLADLQIGSQLTKDYEVIVRSRPILEDVIQNLGLNMSHQDLEKKISINNPTDTRILSISVTDPDPVMAKTIVDEVANASSEYIDRDTIACMSSPHAFQYSFINKLYKEAVETGVINEVEPHTTTLMYKMGKTIYFSKGSQTNIKITQKEDLDLFEGYLLMKEKHKNDGHV